MTGSQAFDEAYIDEDVKVNWFKTHQLHLYWPPCGVTALEQESPMRKSSKVVPGRARGVLKGLGGVVSSGHMVIITRGH